MTQLLPDFFTAKHVARVNQRIYSMFYFRLLVEEFRKTLVELRRSRTALSPANLFAVIWKVVPTFRSVKVR